MKLLVCSVLDKKVEAYLPPVFFRSEGEALRSFMDALTNEKSQFIAHREDYQCVHIGFFDDNLGMLIPNAGPRVLLDGATFLNASPETSPQVNERRASGLDS